MATIIKLTPPNQAQETIVQYSSVQVQQTITDRAGSFTLNIPYEKTTDISRFVVGTDVQITQNGHSFRGFVTQPPLKLDGKVKTISLQGADYAAKTQKVIVTESYTNKTISYIINDIWTKYISWATLNIQNCAITIDFRIPDLFLWDVMETLCTMSGFGWNVDSNLQMNFFSDYIAINSNILTENTFYKGTADFNWDASKLVNKLWVKGSNTLSNPLTETKTVTAGSPIRLLYQPSNISVTVGGVNKTVGIQNIDTAGTKDFLLNWNESLLIPDLCTTGTASITYQYQYPVKVLLWDNASLATYGQFEDIFKVNTSDVNLATQMGLSYLTKYSKPVLIGSLSPINGIYNAGESIKVNIPNLEVDEYLIIKSVSYESTPLTPVKIKLELENQIGDLTNILKQFSQRLDKLESLQTQNNNEVVQQYRTYNDPLIYPKLTDDGITWFLHDYLVAGMPMAGGFYI